VDHLGGADWAGTVYPTHGIELARQAAEQGYELVVAVGGDGTAHEVINGLMQIPAERRPKFGVIPLGSGNDFAYGLGMHHDPVQAMQQIFSGRTKRIDVIRISDNHNRVEYCGNATGIGFDATVTIRSRKFVMVHGFIVYLLAVLQTILLNHEAAGLEITTDEGDWKEEALLLVLCNGSREGGGFHIAPEAKPDDGIATSVSIKKVSQLRMVRLLPEVLRGTHIRYKDVRVRNFRRMELISDRPLTIHIDGEIFSRPEMDVRRLRAELVPGALEVNW
jgi:YegS/Rv2252/BmrU family lipid kinase